MDTLFLLLLKVKKLNKFSFASFAKRVHKFSDICIDTHEEFFSRDFAMLWEKFLQYGLLICRILQYFCKILQDNFLKSTGGKAIFKQKQHGSTLILF